MPPGRPPKRSRPSRPQSPPPSPTPKTHTTTNADTATHPNVQASSPSHPSTSFISADDDARRLSPFLNTTFSTHRLSPLYIGSQPLTQDRIHTLSRRLRDFLVGDVVRGVEVGLDRSGDDGAMARAGALEAVAIAWVTLDSLVGSYAGQTRSLNERDADPEPAMGSSAHDEAGDMSGLSTSTAVPASPGKRRALQISLQYEHAECAALLLPSPKGIANSEDAATPGSLSNFANGRPDENDPEFLHLPLLLLRMPAPLKAAITGFLSRTFDCRISALSLGSRSLVRALETWAGELGVHANAYSPKDVVITLGFYSPTVMRSHTWLRPRQQQQQQQQGVTLDKHTEREEDDASGASETVLGVKSIDVIIPSADLRRFICAGKAGIAGQDNPSSRAGDRRKGSGEGDQDCYGEAKRRKLGGDKDEEGWAWRQRPAVSKHSGSRLGSGSSQPFTEALAQYIQHQLSLDMFHPAVRISKIACGGFVLSEGRVKLFGVAPSMEGDNVIPDTIQRAVWGVLDVLLNRALVKLPYETLPGMPLWTRE
ncbi:siroheme synthase [Diaporthe amygdali]|uniref:siroheme synthase n=1 Tax=Phomopsis amygdali TaxID=1214568 RepID=UPI0022FE2DBE|nr:siroheme synthase [Diaporthe amygdali]KAJ0118561.1 siroheme synthase [Diaporthe amygdali]